ncbi:AmmeMemoRadiSam system radical SAM enzyme [Acidobacteriota bacterium]
MKEAVNYTKLEENKVECYLCSHRCVIKPGKRGICLVRENSDGTLYSLVYDKVCSIATDPIEKKPLYHFLPRTPSLSIATVGCNFRCLHCQNFSISQLPREYDGALEGMPVTPQQIVDEAVKSGSASISYTYTEPTIYFELAMECGKLSRERGLKNVFVTNGYMTPETIDLCTSFLDAANVDLKGFDEKKYKKICGAKLKHVLEAIRLLYERKIWIEITTLLIPDHNDSPEELTKIAQFIASVSPSIPWHVSAFYPTFKMQDRPPTNPRTVEQACQIGVDAGLRYVYSGNVHSPGFSATQCWKCHTSLIKRSGFSLQKNRIPDGVCPECSAQIDGVFQ